MRHYSSGHAAFFEAALADWPTPVLEWLASDLPKLTDLFPTNSSGMILKDHPWWVEIQHEATDELLPDWCFNCGYIDSYIPGGKLRDGCHRCVDTLDPNDDGYMRALMRVCLTLTANMELGYTDQLADYLILCHVKWRQQAIESQPKQHIETPTPIKRTSLLDKLRP
jgi:hypothetical protein